MSNAVAQSFLDLVRRSQLIEEDQLDKFLAEFTARHDGSMPEAQEKLADALVAAEMITQWQADKLLAGKHKGFVLGKYKLMCHLGKGGMSTVYLAEHMLMKRKVAIKVLPQNRVDDSTYLERFRVEARAAAKLDDPNIVRAFDIDSTADGRTHYLVMEYVEGKDLHVLIKEKGRLDYDSAADYIAQVASGLHHAHERGLVHRDIKPANCLLDKNATVKLLDMGLARLIDDEASLTLENNENVLGTADYLAPEQALNSHQADRRADIYSLGCTLYFLITGHPPFPEGSISERLLKHQVETAPSILKERPDAPQSLVHICERMMAKKVEDRFQTALDVANRLTEWLADRGHEVGDSSKKTGSDSGIGSDVYRRFAASIGQTASDSGSAVHGNKTDQRSTSRGTAGTNTDDDEDIGLAPLDEEVAEATELASTTDDITSATQDKFAEVPKKSLIEETLEAAEAEEQIGARFRHQPGEINPLRPPGFEAPRYGPPAWLYVVIGVGICAALGIVLALVFGGL